MRLETRFVTSALTLEDCPRWERAELAIAGRSNVGKSSLLNALVHRRALARTSKTPGRTRMLNFFALDEEIGLVDLPGYGYAKMPRREALKIGAMMREYLNRRRNLRGLLLVIDSRRGPEEEELAIASVAARRGLNLLVAATKCDKLKRSQRAAAARRFEPLVAKTVFCSALSGEGVETLRRWLMTGPLRPNAAAEARG